MKILKSFILIKKLSKEQLGQIVMPESFQDEWTRGEVVQVGPKVEADIKAGDIVIFPPSMGGNYPTIGEENLLIVPEQLIWAVDD